jgi:hypothetical protein
MTAAWPAELVPMGLRGGVVHLVYIEDRPARAICFRSLVATLEPVTAGDARLCKRCAEALPVMRDHYLPRRRREADEAAMWREIMQGVREMGQRVADIRADIEDISERIGAEEQRRRRPPRRRRCR